MIRQYIKELSKTDAEVYSVVGTVTEVDVAARICTVEPLNGDAALYDIRLQAIEEGTDGFVLIPAKDSWVLVTFMSKETGYVAKCSTVDKVIWTVDKQEFEFSKDGMSLKNDQAAFAEEIGTLMDTLDAFIQTMTEFQLSTNMGPTIAVMPQIITKLMQHKTDFAQVKTNLKTMIY